MRYERYVNIYGVLRAYVSSHLTDRLKEWKALDITHGSPNLNEADVETFSREFYPSLNLVSDVWDYLHRTAEVVSTTLVRDNGLVYLARGEVVELRHTGAHETLIVPEV